MGMGDGERRMEKETAESSGEGESGTHSSLLLLN